MTPSFKNESKLVCQPTQGVTEPNNLPYLKNIIEDINTFTIFMRALKVPPRGPITSYTNQGQAIFELIGCASCHVETLTTLPAGTGNTRGPYTLAASVVRGDTPSPSDAHLARPCTGA